MVDLSKEKDAYNERREGWLKAYEEVKKAKKKKGGHLGSSFGDRFNRGSYYRNNGYFYIDNNKDRKPVYDKPITHLIQALKETNRGTKVPGIVKGSSAHARLFLYNYSGKDSNDETQYNFLNSAWPYKTQAHHILPNAVFSDPNFNEKQRMVLAKLPFYMDHGENIIFLPEGRNDQVYHLLPQHHGSHDSYNDLIHTDVKQIAKDFVEQSGTPCEADDPPDLNLMKDVVALETKYWNFLVNSGAKERNTVNQHAKDAQSTEDSGDI